MTLWVVVVTVRRVAFRHAVRQRLLPSLRAFNPDLVLLSAGFDGGVTDQGNVKLIDPTRPQGLDLENGTYPPSFVGRHVAAETGSAWLAPLLSYRRPSYIAVEPPAASACASLIRPPQGISRG